MIDQLELVAQAEESSRSERWPQAAAHWQAVVEVNPVNGVYWDRLAEARFAAGDHAGALVAGERAEALGTWPVRGSEPVPLRSIFPGEISYRIAQCHALLGDTEQAFAALAKAARQHLRDLDRVATDPHLASLRDDPRLRELLGTPDGDRPSRVDGWRGDLRTLRREVTLRAPFPHLLDGIDAAAAALESRIAELDDAKIVVELWRLLRRLGDGHAYVDADRAFPAWGHRLPVWFYLFEEGLFIPQADPRYRHLLGAEVVAVDARPVREVIDALDPFLTRDNDQGATASAPVWLRRPLFLHAVGAADHPDRVTLTARLAGGAVTDVAVTAEPGPQPRRWPQHCPPDSLRLTGDDGADLPGYLRKVDTLYWFEHLPAENLIYFQFNGIADRPDEPLAAFYRRLFAAVDAHRAAALVVDLRFNGGGNTFLAQSLVHHVIRRDRINRRGALFVIVGRDTFSAAQNTATLFDRHTNAVFVGEPSGSRPNFVGETAPFRLPHSGIEVNVSDVYWQTSWPFDFRTAIAPDIYAPPTIAAYRANRDPAMDAILDHLRNRQR